MLKKWPSKIWTNLVIAVIVINLLLPSWANAYQVVNKTSSEEIITEGAVLETVKIKTDDGPLTVYVVRADLNSPYLKVDTIVGADGTLNKNQAVTALANRVGAVAAINGDFFQMKESGRPIGLVYQNGRLLESPALRNDMFGFGITADKTTLLEIFEFSGRVTTGSGKSYPLSGINKPEYLLMSDTSSDMDTLTLYDSMWGTTSRGKLPNLTGIVEVVVKNGVVQQVLTDQPGVPIPRDGYVLKGHGQAAQFIADNLPVGAKVSFDASVTPGGEQLLAAVGGQALLVEDGHFPPYFSQNITGKHARTALGVSRDGKTLYLVAVEKQAASDGALLSRGMTQEELASFLISIGVWKAVNLDGGGSTTLAARHLGDFDASLINRPQGTSQRAVPNAVGLFSTAPQGTLSGLTVSGPGVILAGVGGEFKVKGFDQYHNPSRIDPLDVKWSVEPTAGEFQGNVFLPDQGGDVTVSASLGQVRGAAVVRVVGSESLSGLLVKPSSINVEPGRSVDLSVQVQTMFGEFFDLAAKDVTWTVDPSLGNITGSTFTGADKTGSGELRVAFQGLSVNIPVSVARPGVELQVDPEQDARISLDEKLTIEFPAGSVSEPAKIGASFTDTPDNLPAGCVPLGTVTVSPAGTKVDLSAPWHLEWKYSGDQATGRPAILYWDPAVKKWREQPGRTTGEGADKKVFSKVWGFGKVALVDDQRSVPAFKDTGKHWARPAIGSLAVRGVVNGFPDGSFQPDQGVTRAQFVTMLSGALQWPAPESDPVFKDTIPPWARAAVAAAVSRGVVTGYPDGAFAPDARITRSEMAVMINRALALGDAPVKVSYFDAGSIPAFAREAVEKVSGAGLLQGSGGSFRPRDGATRAETAAAIDRLLNWWVQ